MSVLHGLGVHVDDPLRIPPIQLLHDSRLHVRLRGACLKLGLPLLKR